MDAFLRRVLNSDILCNSVAASPFCTRRLHLPCILALFLTSFLIYGHLGQAYAMESSGLIIPLYSYPGTMWDELIHEKNAHNSVPMMAIVNPANGPGTKDQNYVAGVYNLQKAGIVVLGYVYTNYGAGNTTEIESEMNSYKNWYGVNGIFFDAMSNVAGNEGFYSQLTSYAKSIGLSYTVGNPGADTLPSYVGTVDNIVIHDKKGLPPLSLFGGWHANFTRSDFSFVSYGVNDLNETYLDSAMKSVKYLYVTDLTLPNPFISPASYIDKLVSVIETQEQNNATVPITVGTYSDDDKPLNGFWITAKLGKNSTAGFSPFSFNATTGQQYDITAADYGSYVFEHWDDGSTKNPRTIIPMQNLTLTAYYGINQTNQNFTTSISNQTNSTVQNQTNSSVQNQTNSSGLSNQTQGTTPVQTVPQTTQGIGQMKNTGSVIVNTMYPTGDRADSAALSFKIYQDTNQTLYRQVNSVPSNPFYIGSLPLNHRYKVEAYVNGMCADINYVNLEQSTANLKMFLPLPAGMRINVLYNDGFTPISNATVIVKSQDNKTQASGSTDASGESVRFWLEPTSRNAFYTVEVGVDPDITHTYSPVFLYPGYATISGYDQEIRIVTPWTSPANNAIDVKVYDAKSNPYASRDGNLVVSILDKDGAKIAQSQVNPRGEAYFTNIRVGDYLIDVRDLQSNTTWGDAKITFDGKKTNFDIHETPSQVNQTSMVPSVQTAPYAHG